MEIRPSISSEYYTVDQNAASQLTFSVHPSFDTRVKRLLPGIIFKIFALFKICSTFLLIHNCPLPKEVLPVVMTLLAMDVFLLLAALSQDFCSLFLAGIMSLIVFLCNLILLILIPIAISTVFAEHNSYFKYLEDLKHGFNSRKQQILTEELAIGITIEIFFFILFIISAIQLGVVLSTLNAKLDELNEKKQEKEKRNSVYVL